VLRIGGNTFYNRKNEFSMKIPEFKRSGIGIIAEFLGIPIRFPNQEEINQTLRNALIDNDHKTRNKARRTF
jgi:hypothetical protein